MGPSSIRPLDPAHRLTSIEPLKPASKGAGQFASVIGDFTKGVDRLQQEAGKQVAQLASGKVDNLHQVMVSLGKAEIAFNYMLEIRNRLVEAYKEVMRMQV